MHPSIRDYSKSRSNHLSGPSVWLRWSISSTQDNSINGSNSREFFWCQRWDRLRSTLRRDRCISLSHRDWNSICFGTHSLCRHRIDDHRRPSTTDFAAPVHWSRAMDSCHVWECRVWRLGTGSRIVGGACNSISCQTRTYYAEPNIHRHKVSSPYYIPNSHSQDLQAQLEQSRQALSAHKHIEQSTYKQNKNKTTSG